uniref:RRM domain-containing protein n=1 Tax=Meloidogyne incognita TaxID=6306 RepID=A0A914KXR9_MELIC
MNGVQIGRRAIRTGWAIRRSGTEQLKVGSEDEKEEYSNSNATFESIYNSTEADNTTIYLGGLSSAATEEPIKLAFSEFGIIKEIRLFASQNFGFVVFSDKTSATKAILEMHGKELNLGIVGGKCRLRVKWGKPVQQQQQQNNNGKGGDKGWILNNDSVNLALNNQQNSAVVAAVAQQQQQQLALASAILQAQQQQQPIFQHPVLMGGVVQQTPTFQQSQQLIAQLAAQQQQQQNLQQSLAYNNGFGTFLNGSIPAATNWPQTQQF